jgi:purine-nucleoside phosphorylase
MAERSLYEQIVEAGEFVRRHFSAFPEIVVVLGSGLGAFADQIDDRESVEYAAIPNWPSPTAVGHAGRLSVGRSRSHRVAVLSGRSHIYEGGPIADVTFGVRVAGWLGARVLILTNAAGGMNPDFAVGDLMVIDDHINFMGRNPLIGPNDNRLGPRFPDMSEVYSLRLRSLARVAAQEAGQRVQHGVYLAVTGPNYETPAEISAFRALGADAVGMSTVPEAIVARHMGMEVLGISCISNMAAGMLPQPLSEHEVLETTARVKDRFIALVEQVIERL